MRWSASKMNAVTVSLTWMSAAPSGAPLHPTDQTNSSPSSLSKQGPDLDVFP